MKIGFIGAGQMAQALCRGIGQSRPDVTIAAADPNEDALANLSKILAEADHELTICPNNADVVAMSDIIFLAVKPHFVERAVDSITDIAPQKMVVSVVAGLTLAGMEKFFNHSLNVRVMPNTPCLVASGAIAVSFAPQVRPDQVSEIMALLAPMGDVHQVEESLLNAVTGLSGSGPAFVYTFAEAMIDAGVRVGLPRALARQLSLQTIMGSIKMIQETGQHPAELRDQVTSPGGTTIRGMGELERCGLRNAVNAAVSAASERANELS